MKKPYKTIKINLTYKGVLYSNLLLNKRRKNGMWNFGGGLGYIIMSDWREDSMDFSGLFTLNELRIIVEKNDKKAAVTECLKNCRQIIQEGRDQYAKTHNGAMPKPKISMSGRYLQQISAMVKQHREISLAGH